MKRRQALQGDAIKCAADSEVVARVPPKIPQAHPPVSVACTEVNVGGRGELGGSKVPYFLYFGAFAWLVFVTVLHFSENSKYEHLYAMQVDGKSVDGRTLIKPDSTGLGSSGVAGGFGRPIFEVTSYGIFQRTGSWFFHFFQLPILLDTPTTVNARVLKNAGFPVGAAEVLDLSNPKPFPVFIGLLCAGLIQHHTRGRVRILFYTIVVAVAVILCLLPSII